MTNLITPEDYIWNLVRVAVEAKQKMICRGDATKPTKAQQHLMARVMNACGYCSAKWINEIREKRKESGMRKTEKRKISCVRDNERAVHKACCKE